MLGGLNLRNERLFVVEGATVEETEHGTLTQGGTLVEVANVVGHVRPEERWGSDQGVLTTVLLTDGRTLTVRTADLVVVPIHTP